MYSVQDAYACLADPVIDNIASMKDQVNQKKSTSSKINTYAELNPFLQSHPVYGTQAYIPDYHRRVFYAVSTLGPSFEG